MKINKKYMTFGLISLLAVSLVSAGLVSYLSNTATADVKIESPMVMAFAGDAYGDTATKGLGTIYGGDIIEYKVYSKNQASVDIESYPITTIVSYNSEWTGEEFESVIFEGNTAPGTEYEILSKLYVVKDNGDLSPFTNGVWKTSGVANKKTLKIFFDNDGDGTAQRYTHDAGSQSWNDITITTKQGIAPGEYAMKLCHLDDLLGNCN